MSMNSLFGIFKHGAKHDCAGRIFTIISALILQTGIY